MRITREWKRNTRRETRPDARRSDERNLCFVCLAARLEGASLPPFSRHAWHNTTCGPGLVACIPRNKWCVCVRARGYVCMCAWRRRAAECVTGSRLGCVCVCRCVRVFYGLCVAVCNCVCAYALRSHFCMFWVYYFFMFVYFVFKCSMQLRFTLMYPYFAFIYFAPVRIFCACVFACVSSAF